MGARAPTFAEPIRTSVVKACCQRKVAMSRPLNSTGQGSGEFEEATAQRRIVNLVIGADQFDRLAPTQRIGIEGIGSRFCEARRDRRRAHRIHIVEEERHGDVQDTAQVMQATRPDSIGAPLVFLNLLKGQPDGLAELFLAQAEHVAAQPHARADMDVDWVRLVAFSATRPPGLLLHSHLSVDRLHKGSGMRL
jgi:hypothetical protein